MTHTRFIFAITLLLAHSSGALAADPVNVIRGVNDRGQTGAYHFFELYGDFPDHDASTAYVAAYCHGVRSVGSLTYRSRGQLNVAVPVRPSGVTCSFQLFVPEPEFEDQRHTTASVPRISKGFFA